MKPLVIVATLNEAEHIVPLLKALMKKAPELDILVVDGQSTDGTYELVEKLSQKYSAVKIVRQQENVSYGDAIKQGFRYALEKEYDPILTMDGDGAHDPEYIPNFLKLSSEYGLISGSRYVEGVRVEGWRFRKLLISKLANMYISYVLVKPIWDFTTGYRCYQRRFLQELDLSALHPQAYILQIELIYQAYRHRYRVKEIPTIFRGTLDAPSKISGQSWWRTFGYVLKFRAPTLEIMRHLAYIKKEYERFVAEYEELANPPELKNKGVFDVKESYSVSVGLMAYNEEKIIARCLEAIQNQKLESCTIEEIIVVSSGSTDATDAMVLKASQKDARIRLITQPSRKGKASAINEFLSAARGDICVLESADTIAGTDTVECLIKPFGDKHIGMTGAHPVPVNDKDSFAGFCVHTMWELHHRLAMEHPKCGEMIAFRNIISRMPTYTAVDEASLEAIIAESGLALAYAPKAIVQNKGPETMHDFIKQRRRIASGHRHLLATVGHEVSTKKPGNILGHIFEIIDWTPKGVVYMTALIAIEMYARMMGWFDFYLRDRNPFIWDISFSTKKM